MIYDIWIVYYVLCFWFNVCCWIRSPYSVEAGMIALRREAEEIRHEDFVQGIAIVEAKKKAALQYYG